MLRGGPCCDNKPRFDIPNLERTSSTKKQHLECSQLALQLFVPDERDFLTYGFNVSIPGFGTQPLGSASTVESNFLNLLA
ncbi:hypothetical protein CEXT_393651 [Caerostris extrusa]|uniref:Uncharacterized protein n=1 Tax=Caerostris extrusa TaxID=172846 RepID=A0AAV4W888_CAEEX|nr:hypothetical protein CEXT_393651 [Caerostris extrusa]